MEINLDVIDRDDFYVNEHVFNGELLYLVIPKAISVKWTYENKIFRSSVYNSQGELVSASFPKFTNFGESPEVFPVPKSFNNCKFVQKLDGSTLILSKYKGEFILRTRGTMDASLMEKNGDEIQIFKDNILPKLNESKPYDTWEFSMIFEWVSPKNRIVIFYPEVKWYLIGVVYHSGYHLAYQRTLDVIAKQFSLDRPPIYSFEEIKTFADLIKSVELWKGIEGIVVYSNEDQNLHKCKSLDYISRHKLKSELASFEKLIDFYFNVDHPYNYLAFFDEVVKLTDYETAIEHQGNISRIIDAWKEVLKIKEGITNFVNPLKYLPRKDAAQSIMSSYGNTGRSSMAFTILDNKSLTDDQEKKLLYQCLKK